VASERPSGLNWADVTPFVWPVSVVSRAGWYGRATSQSRTLRSMLAVASSRPFGLNATAYT
jgi:hypothetical protein